LQCIESAVVANFLGIIFLLPAMGSQHTHPLSQRRIIRHDHAAIAKRAQVLGGEKAQAANVTGDWVFDVTTDQGGGTPTITFLLGLFAGARIGDSQCGLRAFTREAYERMELRSLGMELASEMILKAFRRGLRVAEVPIPYAVRKGESKLNTFGDGWRHLRFMLLYSPTHLFLWPGAVLMAIGLPAVLVLAFGPIEVLSVSFGIHWMFVASLLAILGFQVINLGFFARVFSLSSHIDRSEDAVVHFFTRAFRMEHGILVGVVMFALGMINFITVLFMKLRGDLFILNSMRLSIVALTFTVLGAQAIFASFFVSMMVVKRHGWGR